MLDIPGKGIISRLGKGFVVKTEGRTAGVHASFDTLPRVRSANTRSDLEAITVDNDFDTIAARQVSVDRALTDSSWSMIKGYGVCLHRLWDMGARNHDVSVDQQRVACVGRETLAVQCNYVIAIPIAYREEQTRLVLVDHAQDTCRIRRTPCPVVECDPR
jgi:hypothetical protein